MSIFDHPGFMKYNGWAIEVLHADWPAYPSGHGWGIALKSLAVFHLNVRFVQLDDIDQCILFVAVGSGPCLEPKGNLYDPKWFHVAVWHDDLRELHKRGLISGISLITEYEAALRYYERNKDLHVELAGKLHPLDLPRPQRDDYDEDELPVAQIGPQGIVVTSAKVAILDSLARRVSDLEGRNSATRGAYTHDPSVRYRN